MSKRCWLLGVAAMVVTVVMATALAAEPQEKLTPAAVARSTQNPVGSYWVFLDPVQATSGRLALSPRSLARRARADRATRLIDERDYAIRQEIIDSVKRTGATVKSVSRWLKAVVVEASPDQLQRISAMPAVRQIDITQTLHRSPDPVPARNASPKPTVGAALGYGPSLTQNQFIRADTLHAMGLSGKGVLVAMFDAGYDTHHRAFTSTSIIATWDFLHDQADVNQPDCAIDPQNFHGTLTFGALGGYVPDTLIGIAYGADFALAKTEMTCPDSNGHTEVKAEEYNWIAGAEWADSLGADVLSSSLGYDQFQDSGSYVQSQLNGHTALITLAADAAVAKNIVVCNSAGNERGTSWGTIDFPADGDSVLAIGAVNLDSAVTYFSSPGPSADGRIKPDVSTLGTAVFTAAASDGYTYAAGTSLSCPLVAGGIALFREYDSNLTAGQIVQLVRQRANPVRNAAEQPDNNYGYGLFDASRLISAFVINPVASINVAIGQTVTADIFVIGYDTETIAYTLVDTLPGVTLTSVNPSVARLSVTGESANAGIRTVRVRAAYGALSDVVTIRINTQFRATTVGPNPVRGNETLTIFAGGDIGTPTAVTIFTAAGDRVRIVDMPFGGGSSGGPIVWDGRNNNGDRVTPGVYFVFVKGTRGSDRVKVLKLP